MRMTEFSEQGKLAILEVVDNQLKDNTPPETRQTYQRLLGQGFSNDEARELIATVVSSEVFEVLRNKEIYNPKRFIAALHKLPETP